jgi:hypothetical protein
MCVRALNDVPQINILLQELGTVVTVCVCVRACAYARVCVCVCGGDSIVKNTDGNYNIMMRSRLSICLSSCCMSITALTKSISVQFNTDDGFCAEVSLPDLIVWNSDFRYY